MADFPNSIKRWSPTDAGFNYPEDLKEIVYARHVTTLYDEVTAVQAELGAGGLKTSIATGTYTAINGQSWGENGLAARVNNIERGVIVGVNNRVSTAGGSTLTPSAAGVVGLNVRAATDQSVNLVEFRNANNSIGTYIGSDGVVAGVIDGGTA